MKHIKTYKNIQKPIIHYYNSGQKQSEIYYIDGDDDKFHREDGPAYQSWYKNGQIQYKDYYINGNRHREDGSAAQFWYDNDQKRFEKYYINGKAHREDGPGFQSWYENGQKRTERYFINDTEYSIEKWIEQLKKINSPHYEDQLMKYQAEKYNI